MATEVKFIACGHKIGVAIVDEKKPMVCPFCYATAPRPEALPPIFCGSTTFAFDCIVNGKPVKAGTVIDLSAPSPQKPTEWCRAGEFGCECGRSEYEPCPLPHPGAGQMRK